MVTKCTDSYLHVNHLFYGIQKTKKTTEDIIEVYLIKVYSTFGVSKYILSDRGGDFISKQSVWLAKELGFINVYTLIYPNRKFNNEKHTLS